MLQNTSSTRGCWTSTHLAACTYSFACWCCEHIDDSSFL